jgi:DNA modification methylase
MMVGAISIKILQGDVLDGLRTLPDCSVQCCITSPPYYGLRNYNVDGQIGMEETPDAFIQKMVEVFHEVRRVLREDGVLWLNFGDSYSGSMSSKGAVVNQNSMSAGTGQDVGYRDKPMGIVPGYKAKDLMGIPWRVAFALQADGWYLRSAMPWIKRNCMPESTTDRPTSAIEYIFLMTKSAKYFYDADAIRCPSSDSYQNDLRPAGVLRQRVNKKSKYPDAGQFKKQDQTGNPTYTGFNERYKQKNASRDGGMQTMHIKEAEMGKNAYRAELGNTRNYRNSDPFFESWQGLYSEGGEPLALIVNPQARAELHFASFPDKLAETFIKAGTSEYGCCPKCGAPYQRIVEASGGTIGEGTWYPHDNDDITGQSMSSEQLGIARNGSYKREFKGWEPGCDCIIEGPPEAASPVPCVVLDPFMGSGTVAVVARELNRSSVGCELNPEYVKIIKNRLQAGSCLDTGTVEYEFRQL